MKQKNIIENFKPEPNLKETLASAAKLLISGFGKRKGKPAEGNLEKQRVSAKIEQNAEDVDESSTSTKEIEKPKNAMQKIFSKVKDASIGSPKAPIFGKRK